MYTLEQAADVHGPAAGSRNRTAPRAWCVRGSQHWSRRVQPRVKVQGHTRIGERLLGFRVLSCKTRQPAQHGMKPIGQTEDARGTLANKVG